MGTTNQWREGLRETRVQHMTEAEARTSAQATIQGRAMMIGKGTMPAVVAERSAVVFYGVVQDGDNLAIIGYDANVQPVSPPVAQRFAMGIEGMLEASALATEMTRGLK